MPVSALPRHPKDDLALVPSFLQRAFVQRKYKSVFVEIMRSLEKYAWAASHAVFRDGGPREDSKRPDKTNLRNQECDYHSNAKTQVPCTQATPLPDGPKGIFAWWSRTRILTIIFCIGFGN